MTQQELNGALIFLRESIEQYGFEIAAGERALIKDRIDAFHYHSKNARDLLVRTIAFVSGKLDLEKPK